MNRDPRGRNISEVCEIEAELVVDTLGLEGTIVRVERYLTELKAFSEW